MLRDVAKELVPPESGTDPTTWRWKMFVTVVALAAVFAFHVAGSKGLIPGVAGVAHAADIEKVNAKIDRVQRDLKSEIADVKNDVADVATSQRTLLRLALAQEICRIYWLRMDADGLLLSQLNASFDRQQEEYASINDGVRYAAIECGPQ